MSLTSFLSNVLGPVAPQSEEEARRRYEEEQKAQEALLKEEAAKPVTQTLKIDPSTGEQTLTISGSPEDLSAANPLTPTVAQPGMPVAPVAPTSFDEFGTPTAPQAQAQQMPTLPQPGPATQVAGPVPPEAMRPPQGQAQQMAPRAAPVAPQAQAPRDEFAGDRTAEVARYEAQNGPMDPAQKARLLGTAPQRPMAPVAPAAGPTPAQAQQLAANAQTTPVAVDPDARWTEEFRANQNNPQALAYLYSEKSGAPEYIRRAAGDQLKMNFQQEQEKKKADEVINGAMQKAAAGNGSDFARLLQQQKGEGSYVKAYLFQRLGLADLAKAEQAKLGAENKWMPAMGLNGERAMIHYASNGQPLSGYDNTGRQLSGDELAAFSVNSSVAKGAVTGQTFGKAPIGAETHTISHTVLPNGAGVIWKDETTGKTLPSAPAGYMSMGSQNPVTQSAIKTAAAVEAKMRKMNADVKQTGSPIFSEEDILREKEKVFNGGMSTIGAGGEPIVPPTAANAAGTFNAGQAPKGENAVQIATRLGLPIISGVRDTDKQQAIYDESVRAGRTGFTATGNPIAKPGTSKHENANAVDLDVARMTPEQIQLAQASGLMNRLPNDKNHFELAGAPAPAAAPAQGKSIAQQMLDYEIEGPKGPATAAKLKLQSDINRLAAEQGKVYDGQKYKENTKIINDFTPSGQAGKSVVAMGTAASHIGDLRPLITALNQGDSQATNLLINNVKKWTGDPNVTNLEAVGPAVAAEIQKTFVSGGGGTGAERDELSKAFGSARSKEQLEGAVKMYENLMVGKLGELEKQYARTGRKDFWTNIVSDDRLKTVYDRHHAERAAREGKPLAGQTKTGVKYKVVTE